MYHKSSPTYIAVEKGEWSRSRAWQLQITKNSLKIAICVQTCTIQTLTGSLVAENWLGSKPKLLDVSYNQIKHGHLVSAVFVHMPKCRGGFRGVSEFPETTQDFSLDDGYAPFQLQGFTRHVQRGVTGFCF